MGAMCPPRPHWETKNLSQKGFCGAFSLKKRPLRPQAPSKKQLSAKIYKKIKNFSNKKSKSSLQFGIYVI